MLSKCAKVDLRSPGPKWNQLEDDRLTQSDFYDDLFFPREAFRLEAGVGYSNEQAMLSSMNTLHKALRKGSGEEWKIFFQPDDSRVIRLVKPEPGCKEKNKVQATLKDIRSKGETGLKNCENPFGNNNSVHEFVVGRGRSSHTADGNLRSKLTIQKKQSSAKLRKEKKDATNLTASLSQLRSTWDRKKIKNKSETTRRMLECGDFEPFSREELVKIAEEKKRYLELTKNAQERREYREDTERQYTGAKIVELCESVEDGDDSDSSVPSFRTRIIRYAPKKEENSKPKMSSSGGLDVKTKDDVTSDLDVANLDEISENEPCSEMEQKVALNVPENKVVNADDLTLRTIPSEYDKITADSRVDENTIKVENNAVSGNPLKIDTAMWASMVNQHVSSKPSNLGIFNRSQWYRDLEKNNSDVISRRHVKEGYDLKMQKETSNRLSIPKHGPFSMKRDDLKPTKEGQTEHYGTKKEIQDMSPNECYQTSSGELYLKQKARSTVANASERYMTTHSSPNNKPLSLSHVKGTGLSENSKLRKKRNSCPPRPEFNLRTIEGLYDSPNFITRSVTSFRSQITRPTSYYYAKQTGFGDAVSKTSKNSFRCSLKPDFNLRTSVGLLDRPKLFAQSETSIQPKMRSTRRMPPMVESSIVSSSEVNRRKSMRNIDNENMRIATRLGDIKKRRQITQKKISFRGLRREQLPLVRIQNRAETK